ncbi:phosphoserine phosphatase SerB [Candidatus Puniceispirillum sp.]|uniref:phosphoserine phosphatase SerB n=1 Tax=Candidatus Puniceispirillum sp. TaxID=2026719 RepID=UPI003F698F64
MNDALIFSTSKATTAPARAADWIAPLLATEPDIDIVSEASWLARGSAAETIVANDKEFDVGKLRAVADDLSIDINIVPAENRRKRLLIADMDSTIINSESLDDLARLAGLGDDIAHITAQSMAGQMDFEDAVDARVAMLAGKPVSLFDQLLDEMTLTAGAVALVKTMRANGAFCYLVSGGFDFATSYIADMCGFHDNHANHMNISSGLIEGTVRKPILDRDAKASYLAQYCATHDLTMADAATIGDGANDLAMLKAADLGVAFQGKPLLRKHIDLQLNHTDLTGLLYLQGYSDSEFVS